MAAWPRLAAAVALAIAAGPAFAQQSGSAQPALAYPQIVSAAQDCLDSYKGLAVDQKQLKKRGWVKATLEGFGNLGGIITAIVRGDGAVMLVTRYSCIVKTRLTSTTSVEGLAAAISENWGAQPTPGADGHLAWLLPERKFELTPGPSDGSNVNLTISLRLAEVG